MIVSIFYIPLLIIVTVQEMILFLPKFKRNLTMNGVITLQQLLCYKYVIQDLFLILSNLKLPIDRRPQEALWTALPTRFQQMLYVA